MKIDWEQWLEVLRILKGDSFARLCGLAVVIGGGILSGWMPQVFAAAANKAFGLEVTISNPDPLYGLILIIVSISAATIHVIRKQHNSAPHPSDIALVAKFRLLLTDELLRLLRGHSFREPLNRMVEQCRLCRLQPFSVD